MKLSNTILASLILSVSCFVNLANAGLIINEVNLGSDDYIELVNTGNVAIDLQGFSIDFFESNSSVYTFGSSLLIGAGDILVVGESIGDDVNVGFNIPFNDGTPFSISLFDGSGSIIDFITAITDINVPVGVSFIGGPMADVVVDDSFVYQRITDNHNGSTFYASDWTIATPTKGLGPIANITVPEPSTLAIFALGMIGLASRRFKK